jgi:hypothetical protein
VPLVPIGWEVEWTSETVWTLWRREKSLALAGNRTSAVTVPTELSRLPLIGLWLTVFSVELLTLLTALDTGCYHCVAVLPQLKRA